jgi:hypothetical protein
MFKCKRCQAPTISFFDKYKMEWWQEVNCSNCNARLTANPVVLGAFYFLAYVQMVAWFVALFYIYHDPKYLFYIAVLWIVFDLLGVMLVPMVVLKPKLST